MSVRSEAIELLGEIKQSLADHNISIGTQKILDKMAHHYEIMRPAFEEIWEIVDQRAVRFALLQNIAQVYASYKKDGLRDVREARADLRSLIGEYLAVVEKSIDLIDAINEKAYDAMLVPPDWLDDPLKLMLRADIIDDHKKSTFSSLAGRFNTDQHRPRHGEMLRALLPMTIADFGEINIDVYTAIAASRKSSTKDFIRILKPLIIEICGQQISVGSLVAINDALGTDMSEDVIRKA